MSMSMATAAIQRHKARSSMSIDLHDTITAVASPPGPAARGIIRISGPETAQVIARIYRSSSSGDAWQLAKLPRRWPGTLTLPDFDTPVSCDLFFWPTSRSYTGQIMAELHLTGAVPILEALAEEICCCGARLARRGEFTLRAFLSGRIDLLQAEAVNEVIHAADHEELQTALSQLGGSITGRLQDLRTDLIALIGDLEAGLDFVDEDIEFISPADVQRRISLAARLVHSLASDSATVLPAGYQRRIVLAGQPNAGKSTLFNRLAGAELAVITDIPGTTRDFVSTSATLGSQQIELIDTAGAEQHRNLIELQSQQFRQQQTAAADLIIWCRSLLLSPEQRQQDERLREECLQPGQQYLTVLTQCDRPEPTNAADPEPADATADATCLRVSALTGLGIDQLQQTLCDTLRNRGFARTELLATSSVRCRESLRRALQALETAGAAAEQQQGDELISMELRAALRELQSILGEIYTDDLLDHIFSNFCIGK